MAKQKVIFIVAGRLGKNLIVSKVMPIIYLGYFDRIFIFSEEPGVVIEHTEYISLPGIITKCRLKYLKIFFRIIYEPLQLYFYAVRYKPLYINGIFTNPKGLNSYIISKLTGSRSIISLIGGQPEFETSFFNKKNSFRINLFLFKNCYRVFTKGQKDNQYLISKGVDKNKLVIYNGAIDTNRFCKRDIAKEIDLIYVGSFDENKGPDRFILICRKILSLNRKINAFMLGSGPLFPGIIKVVDRLGLTDEIKLVGKVINVEDYLIRSKILVLPSGNEGLSTAMLEAMACGCVPVVSDVGNNSQAAQSGHNSFLVKDYKDTDEYCNYILKLLSNTILWKELSENAIRTIKEKYSPQAQSRALLNVFI
jgi:glycosyltransferase involved in cell wall biosynthesis